MLATRRPVIPLTGNICDHFLRLSRRKHVDWSAAELASGHPAFEKYIELRKRPACWLRDPIVRVDDAQEAYRTL